MARGYPGAFGRKLNAPYVWIPLCLLFLIPFVDFRRPLRLLHLDLLVLLGFGASHVFFNRGEIGVSVPLVYPVLLYLLVRIALGGLPSARAGRAAGAVRAAHVAGDHARLLGDVPCRPQHRRLERDRRRLRRRDRSRPDRRRRPALRRGVLGGRREGRHLRPGQLPALRALRAGAALERGVGRSARRPRRRDRLRPAGARRPAAARPGAAAGPRGQVARGGARLRLGRLPLHRLRARDELERHARGARVHRRPARLCVAVGCAERYRDGPRRGIQVRSARAGAAVRAPLTVRLRGRARADAARRRPPVRRRLRPA